MENRHPGSKNSARPNHVSLDSQSKNSSNTNGIDSKSPPNFSDDSLSSKSLNDNRPSNDIYDHGSNRSASNEGPHSGALTKNIQNRKPLNTKVLNIKEQSYKTQNNKSNNNIHQNNSAQNNRSENSKSRNDKPQNTTIQSNKSKNNNSQNNKPQNSTAQSNKSENNKSRNDKPQNTTIQSNKSENNNSQNNKPQNSTAQSNQSENNKSQNTTIQCNKSQSNKSQNRKPYNTTSQTYKFENNKSQNNGPRDTLAQNIKSQNDTPHNHKLQNYKSHLNSDLHNTNRNINTSDNLFPNTDTNQENKQKSDQTDRVLNDSFPESKEISNDRIIDSNHKSTLEIADIINFNKDKLSQLGKTVSAASVLLRGRIRKLPVNSLILPFLYFAGLVIYLELIFHIMIYRRIDTRIIYPVLFALPIGTLLTFITGIFKRLVNYVLTWILTVMSCLIFCVQLIYYYVFKVYFSFQSIGMAGDAFSEFGNDIVTAIRANVFPLIFLLLPLAFLYLTSRNHLYWNTRGFREQILLFIATIIFHLLTLASLLTFGRGDYSPYDLYYHTKVNDLCGQQLGVVTMTRIDLVKLITGDSGLVLANAQPHQWDTESAPSSAPTLRKPSNSKPTSGRKETPTPILQPTQLPIDTSPNIMDFDFNALAKEEKNKTIKALHQYFAGIAPTNKNEYTGMFQGYNLILITAEGFSPYAVNKDKTPTLYRLTHEGFLFNNFYTPLWQTSTSDGEYVALTGLIPVGTRSMYRSRNNLLPLTLGHQFDRIGVASKAYHDHTYTYYQRNETHPNLGYDYKGVGNGLVLEHNVWPNSDLEMINATVDDYIHEDLFHVYYMTVSGHMNYTFMGNSMSYKNRQLVEDLPYSSDARAYIACQIELDKALEQLIKKLEAAGVANRTVIALSADHYPYGWDKKNIDEIAGHDVDPNFEIFRNYFILWSEGMTENIVIDKPCSSLDILPTLSNLFGFEYDSRLLMGQDILSDAEPLVILSNRSFITDKVMYNSETGEVTKLTKEELPEGYISTMNKTVKNKFSVSQSILEKDYYRHLYKETGRN